MSTIKKLSIILACFPVYSIAQNADSAKVYAQQAQKFSEERRHNQAINAIEKALSFDSSRADHFIAAAGYYEKVRNNFKMGKMLESAYKRDANNPVLIEKLAGHYYNYNNHAKAIEFLNKCSNCKDKDKMLGNIYYKQDNYPLAEKHFQAHIKKNPADAEAPYMLARTYLDMEYPLKAEEALKAAVAQDPSSAKKNYELAVIFFNNQKYADSHKYFENAMSLGYPKSIETDEQQGYIKIYNGQFDEGMRLIQSVYERRPGDKALMRDIAQLLYEKHQYDRSLSFCQILVTENPEDSYALYQAGLNFLKKGDKEKGQGLCDKAIELNPAMKSLRQEVKMPF